MAKKAESLNLPVTLDTTLNQEEKGTNEMSEGTYEMSEFIGQEEFEDGVQNEKIIIISYFFPFSHTVFELVFFNKIAKFVVICK